MPEDRLVDRLRLDAGAAHRLTGGERAELDGRGIGERPEELPDRGPRALEDDGGLHATSLPAAFGAAALAQYPEDARERRATVDGLDGRDVARLHARPPAADP